MISAFMGFFLNRFSLDLAFLFRVLNDVSESCTRAEDLKVLLFRTDLV